MPTNTKVHSHFGAADKHTENMNKSWPVASVDEEEVVVEDTMCMLKKKKNEGVILEVNVKRECGHEEKTTSG